jgi:hypothetical protein
MSRKTFRLRVHNSHQLVSVMIEMTPAEAHRIFVQDLSPYCLPTYVCTFNVSFVFLLRAI